MRFFVLSFLLLPFTLLSCNEQPTVEVVPTPTTPEAWLAQNAIEMQPNGSYDFNALASSIGDKRIVALGESSHGLGELYRLKAALVSYLHEEQGFEVLAIEGGVGDVNLAYSYVDGFDGVTLRNKSIFGNFRAKEVEPLYNYFVSTSKSTSPLFYAGYDTQSSGVFFEEQLASYVFSYDSVLANSLSTEFNAYYDMFGALRENDSVGYATHRDRYMTVASECTALLKANETAIAQTHGLDAFQLEVLYRTLDSYRRSVDLSWNRRYEAIQLRDELMAENVSWLLNEVYADKKVVLWAHNAHIEKGGLEGSPNKWMGHYLKEQYPNDYFSVGIFAFEGEVYQHWNKEIIPFRSDTSNHIELTMDTLGYTAAYLDLNGLVEEELNRWLFAPVIAFEPENGRVVNFIPTKRFDAVLSLKYSGAPTYED